MADNWLKRLNTFPQQRLLVVGDVMLDEYLWGDAQRISPEAPVPVVEVQRRSYRPGGAANTASNIASLGAEVWLAGIVGADSQAEHLRQALPAGVNSTGLVIDPERPTTTKTRIMAQNQQVGRLDSEWRSPLSTDLETSLLIWIEHHLPQVNACVLSDYGKGIASPIFTQTLIQLARRAGKPIVVDPKGTKYQRYRGATVITPNVMEARRALGLTVDDAVDDRKLGQQLRRLLPETAILLTQGAKGMSLFLPNRSRVLHLPAIARQVFDVTGAGDTVISTLVLALATGTNLADAAYLANQAAGIVVGKPGTATVTIEELRQAIATTTPETAEMS